MIYQYVYDEEVERMVYMHVLDLPNLQKLPVGYVRTLNEEVMKRAVGTRAYSDSALKFPNWEDEIKKHANLINKTEVHAYAGVIKNMIFEDLFGYKAGPGEVLTDEIMEAFIIKCRAIYNAQKYRDYVSP